MSPSSVADTERSWISPVLGDGGDSAVRQLARATSTSRPAWPIVFGRKDLGWSASKVNASCVAVPRTEPEEALDGRAAVRAPCSQHAIWRAIGTGPPPERRSTPPALPTAQRTFTPLSMGVIGRGHMCLLCRRDGRSGPNSADPLIRRVDTLDRSRVDRSPQLERVGGLSRKPRAENDRELGEPTEHEPVTVAPVQLLVGGARRKSGNRRSSAPSAICPSRRARGAPRQ
jgi:hypothetical protein